MKLDRLLAITMLLISRKRVTANELADYFEVSHRTIYRDIEAINQAGIPVVAYQGANGGFELTDQFKLERQLLSSDDLHSIMIALKGVAATFPDHHFSNTINKLKVLVSEADTGTQPADQLIIDFSPWGGNLKQQTKINQVKQAIAECHIIRFTYTNYQGETFPREIEPMSLVLKGFTWYCYGYCLTKQDFRLFRFSRIKDLDITLQKFQRRDKTIDISTMDYEWSSAPLTEIELRFASRFRAQVEDFFDAENVQVEADGYLTVHAKLPENEWGYNYILGFGEGVEVIKPRHIRDLIRQKISQIQSLYQ